MAVRSLVKILPEIKWILDNYNDEKQMFKRKIIEVYEKIDICFNNLPEELITSKNQVLENMNKESVNNWCSLLLGTMFTGSYKYLENLYSDMKRSTAQVPSEDIDEFLKVIDEIDDNITTKALFLLYLGETCRFSDPYKSFDLIMEAFTLKPDIKGILYKENIPNAIYNHENLNDQIEIKNCTVCGGNNKVPYHNAPCYRMSNYSGEFLPAKLYYKCTDCGNLYTRYFPNKYFKRKNTIKFITPEENITHILTPTHMVRLSTWCDILKNIENYNQGQRNFRSWNR